MVLDALVGVEVRRRLRADVDGCGCQSGDLVEEPVLSVVGDVVGGAEVEVGCDGDSSFGADAVSDPAQP